MTNGISNQYDELYKFLATHTFGGESWQQAADRNKDTVIVKQEFTSFIEKWCPEDISKDKDLITQFWQKIDTTANTDKFRYHGTQYVNTGALDKNELADFNAGLAKEAEGKKITNIEIIDDKPYTQTMVDLYNNFFVPDCHVDSVKEYYNYGETFKLGTSIDNYLNNHSDISEGDIINIIKKNARGETLTAEELQTLNAIGLGNDANGWNYTRKCFVKSNCLYNAQNFCNQQYGNYSSLTAVALDSYKTELENNVTSGQYKKYADAIKQINGALSFENSNAKVNLDAAVAVITEYSDISYTATTTTERSKILDQAGQSMLAQANQGDGKIQQLIRTTEAAAGLTDANKKIDANAVSKHSKNNILDQAGQSMLAQSNQGNQNVTELLERGVTDAVTLSDKSESKTDAGNDADKGVDNDKGADKKADNSPDTGKKSNDTGKQALVNALLKAGLKSKVVEYIASVDTTNAVYKSIIQDAAMKLMTGAISQDSVIPYIVEQIVARLDEIVPASVQNETTQSNSSGSTGNKRYPGVGSEKENKDYFTSSTVTKINDELSKIDIPTLCEGIKKNIHTEFGIDSNGEIVFQNNGNGDVAAMYQALVGECSEIIHNNLPGLKNSYSIADRLIQAAWITTYNKYNASTSHETKSFIEEVINNLKNILTAISKNGDLLKLYTADTAYSNDNITSGVYMYSRSRKNESRSQSYNDWCINYSDYTFDDSTRKIKLSDDAHTYDYNESMSQILENLIKVYKEYGLPESTIKDTFYEAQKEALRICKENVKDMAAGCGSANYTGDSWMLYIDSEVPYKYYSYMQEWDAEMGRDCSVDSRAGDKFNIAMPELIQETLYVFDKLIYKKSLEGINTSNNT